MLDQVVLVNERDEEIGTMDKVEAHRGEAKLHRAISVFLLNSRGELLIQQRSAKKIVGAGQWANTCCGNVRPGESYEQCAQRRLKQELGIEGVKLEQVGKFQYAVRCNAEFSEREIDTVFVGRYEGSVKPNPDEVSDITWMKFDEFKSDVETNQTQKYAPWVREIVIHNNI